MLVNEIDCNRLSSQYYRWRWNAHRDYLSGFLHHEIPTTIRHHWTRPFLNVYTRVYDRFLSLLFIYSFSSHGSSMLLSYRQSTNRSNMNNKQWLLTDMYIHSWLMSFTHVTSIVMHVCFFKFNNSLYTTRWNIECDDEIIWFRVRHCLLSRTSELTRHCFQLILI
jgi:hypothetical protein